MQRRSLLKVGAGAGLLLTAAGAGVALWRPGWTDGRLTPAGHSAFAAIGRAVLDGLLPRADPAAALAAWLSRLDATVAVLPPSQQAEFAELASLLVNAPTRYMLTGLGASWDDAAPAELQAMLQRLRMSPIVARQQVYRALRDLSNAAWFAAPSAWQAIGYPGPLAVS